MVKPWTRDCKEEKADQGKLKEFKGPQGEKGSEGIKRQGKKIKMDKSKQWDK